MSGDKNKGPGIDPDEIQIESINDEPIEDNGHKKNLDEKADQRADQKTEGESVSDKETEPTPNNVISLSKDQLKDLEYYKKEYLYLQAEFDNYKKHAIKERSDLLKYGYERLARDILGIVDIFEQALQTEVTPENLTSFIQGLNLTASELKKTLENFGVKQIDSLGQPFNPAIHEALSSEPTDEFDEGTVCRVFKEAYKLHDRVIRPGQVVVAKKP